MAVNVVDSVSILQPVSAGHDAVGLGGTLHRLRIDGAALTVSAGRVSCTLADIVPLACQVADALFACARAKVRQQGQTVPCRKGCAACCHFLTPMSVPEAQWLWRRVQSLPSPRRERLVAKFLAASQTILKSDLPFETSRGEGEQRSPGLDSLSDWYQSLNFACPMLEGVSCGLYDWRPLACREYGVVSDPSECSKSAGRRKRLPLTMSVAESLCELSRQYGGGGAMLLPLVPAWASSHTDDPQPVAPAGEWVERLFEVMRGRAGKP